MKNHIQHLIIFTAISIIFTTPATSLAWKGIGSNTPAPPAATSEDVGAHEVRKKMTSQHKDEVNAVVARVNGAGISMKKLMNNIMEIIIDKYGNLTITSEIAQKVRYDALQKLILEELAYQRALSLGIVIDEQTLERHIEAIRKNAGSPENFEQSLTNKQQTLAELKSETMRGLAVKEAVKIEVEDKIIIKKEEVERIYRENIDQFVIPEQVVVTDIVFFLDPNSEETRKKVTAIRTKIINELHNNPNRLEADGFRVIPGMKVSPLNYPNLYKEGKKLEVNEISDFLVIDGTPHLIKLEHYKAEEIKPEDKVKAYIRRTLKSRKQKADLAQWRQNLGKGAEIEIVHELLQNNK